MKLSRIDAIKIISGLADMDDPRWDNIIGEFSTDSDYPSIFDLYRALDITDGELIEATGIGYPKEAPDNGITSELYCLRCGGKVQISQGWHTGLWQAKCENSCFRLPFDPDKWFASKENAKQAVRTYITEAPDDKR